MQCRGAADKSIPVGKRSINAVIGFCEILLLFVSFIISVISLQFGVPSTNKYVVWTRVVCRMCLATRVYDWLIYISYWIQYSDYRFTVTSDWSERLKLSSKYRTDVVNCEHVVHWLYWTSMNEVNIPGIWEQQLFLPFIEPVDYWTWEILVWYDCGIRTVSIKDHWFPEWRVSIVHPLRWLEWLHSTTLEFFIVFTMPCKSRDCVTASVTFDFWEVSTEARKKWRRSCRYHVSV